MLFIFCLKVSRGNCYFKIHKSYPNQQILDSSGPKEFADNNFKFDENGRLFSKWLENTEGKGEICSLRAVSPFATVFSNDLYSRCVKSRASLGKG